MKREPLYYLKIMQEYCCRAISYIDGVSIEQFINNNEKQDSISHVLYRMSEASVQIDEQFKNENPEIQWKDIYGLRVLLAHIYHNVDFSILYNITTSNIPSLSLAIERVMKKIGQ